MILCFLGFGGCFFLLLGCLVCLVNLYLGGRRFWGDVEPGWFEIVAAVPTQRNGTGHKGKLVGDGKRGTFFFFLFVSLVPSMVASMEDQQNFLSGNTLGIQPHKKYTRNTLGGIHWEEYIGNTCIPMQMNKDNFG